MSITRMQYCTDEHKWEIDQLDMVFHVDEGDTGGIGYVESPKYEMGLGTGLHSKWTFRVTSKNSNVVFGVRLAEMCVRGPKRFKYGGEKQDLPFIVCKYNVKLMNDDKEIKSVTKSKYCHSLEGHCCFMDEDEDPAFYEYTDMPIMPVEEFRGNKTSYFPDNKLKLLITFTLFFQPQHETMKTDAIKSIQSIFTNSRNSTLAFYRDLLNNPQFSDVRIIGGGREFLAHKLILHGRNAWFRNKIDQLLVLAGPDGAEGEIRINMNEMDLDVDLDVETVNILLRFIYAGDAVLPEQVDEIEELIKAANACDVQELKTASFHKLISIMDNSNCGKIAVMVYSHNGESNFRDLVQGYCVQRHKELIKNAEYRELYVDFPQAFLQVPGIPQEEAVAEL